MICMRLQFYTKHTYHAYAGSSEWSPELLVGVHKSYTSMQHSTWKWKVEDESLLIVPYFTTQLNASMLETAELLVGGERKNDNDQLNDVSG